MRIGRKHRHPCFADRGRGWDGRAQIPSASAGRDTEGDSREKRAALASRAWSSAFVALWITLADRILSTNAKFDDAPSLDLVAWCREELGLPLKMENDARLALLGEWYAGAARGCDDVVMITLGTGIGGAAMSEGRLLRGKHSQAGCLGGHLPVDFEGRVCSCGAIGCAEAEASSVSLPEVCRCHPEILDRVLLLGRRRLRSRSYFSHLAEGDRVAQDVADRCLRVWAATTVGLIHAYDPELVIVGGGVMKSAAQILPFLQAYVAETCVDPVGKSQSGKRGTRKQRGAAGSDSAA